jgi:hypothetical protein
LRICEVAFFFPLFAWFGRSTCGALCQVTREVEINMFVVVSEWVFRGSGMIKRRRGLNFCVEMRRILVGNGTKLKMQVEVFRGTKSYSYSGARMRKRDFLFMHVTVGKRVNVWRQLGLGMLRICKTGRSAALWGR